VDARAAHDGYAPAAVRARAEQRERVVVNDQPAAPRQLLDLGAEARALLREVCTGEQDVGDRCEWACELSQVCLGDGTLQQLLEHRDSALDPESVSRASTSPNE